MNTSYLSAIKEDGIVVRIRPSLRKVAGSFIGGAILAQIIYLWDKSKGQPFYKFKTPCDHVECIDSKTWTKELGITVDEFDSAIRKLAYNSAWKSNIFNETDAIVVMHSDATRKTFYTLNESKLEEYLASFYVNGDLPFTKTVDAHLPACARNNTKTEYKTEEEIAPSIPRGEVSLNEKKELFDSRGIPKITSKTKKAIPSAKQILDGWVLPSWISSDPEALKWLNEWLVEHQRTTRKAYIDINRARSSISGFFNAAQCDSVMARVQLRKAWESNWQGLHMPDGFGIMGISNVIKSKPKDEWHPEAFGSSEEKILTPDYQYDENGDMILPPME